MKKRRSLKWVKKKCKKWVKHELSCFIYFFLAKAGKYNLLLSPLERIKPERVVGNVQSGGYREANVIGLRESSKLG